MSQVEAFYEDEANAWYLRNSERIEEATLSVEMEPIIRVLKPFESKIDSILEIGCSDGRRLEYLCRLLRASGYGIDPSLIGVNQGNHRFGLSSDLNVELLQGDARLLPFSDEIFDLVFYGFCLYLVDREDLNSAILEADRVLKANSFLAIFDFDVRQAQAVPYVHRNGLYTYKDDYPQRFINLGNYHLVHKVSFGHGSTTFQMDQNERISISLLFKEFTR